MAVDCFGGCPQNESKYSNQKTVVPPETCLNLKNKHTLRTDPMTPPGKIALPPRGPPHSLTDLCVGCRLGFSRAAVDRQSKDMAHQTQDNDDRRGGSWYITGFYHKPHDRVKAGGGFLFLTTVIFTAWSAKTKSMALNNTRYLT